MQAAIAFTHQHVSNIAIPVLLLVAEDDHLVDRMAAAASKGVARADDSALLRRLLPRNF
jgi:alpha-beta hydrolase superfamily lysophospholipase